MKKDRRRRVRRRRLVLGAALLAVVGGLTTTVWQAGAALSPEQQQAASPTGQQLEWKQCAPPAAQPGGGVPGGEWECSTLTAPLDYDKPDGETIGIALIRAKATDPARRIGSLVTNFGGPGGSGVEILPQAERDFATLRSRYDLVSFDPRGVGASEGIKCLDEEPDAEQNLGSVPGDTAAQVEAFMEFSRKNTSACMKNSGKVLPYVGTRSAARDMDLLRQALGEEKLNYYGLSYGTMLGAVYAHMFPEHVGRTVLDGVMNPDLYTGDPAQLALDGAKGFQRGLEHFLAECASHGNDCATGPDPKRGEQKIIELLSRLDQRPLPTQDGRGLTRDQALGAINGALYAHEAWPQLGQALAEADQAGTGNLLLEMADQGEQGGLNQDAFTAITCADTSKRYTPREVMAMLPEFREASPVFGESQAQMLLACSSWPVKGEKEELDVSVKNVPPILLVGTTGDPATPYEWTRAMAEALGDGAGVQITNQGEGHGAYGHGACVNATVNAYFLDDKTPADGTTCPPDPGGNAKPPAETGPQSPDPGGPGEYCPGVTADSGPSQAAGNRQDS